MRLLDRESARRIQTKSTFQLRRTPTSTSFWERNTWRRMRRLSCTHLATLSRLASLPLRTLSGTCLSVSPYFTILRAATSSDDGALAAPEVLYFYVQVCAYSNSALFFLEDSQMINPSLSSNALAAALIKCEFSEFSRACTSL